jgi:peptidoglycan DL-endopeptidase LytF
MDRKKTIVAAVMINAAILTVLFIAAMTMREVPAPTQEIGRTSISEPKPLFKENVEIPMSAAAPFTEPPRPQPLAFSLPPSALIEPEPVEPPLAPIAIAPAPVPEQRPQKPLSESEIEVQKGDTLEKLAKQYRTSVDEIIQLNQLPSSFLKIGQRLKIPAGKTHEAPKPKSPVPLSVDAEYYTMKVGDNPWSIAMKHHMKVDELLKLNGLNEKSARKLKPGDRLRIR